MVSALNRAISCSAALLPAAFLGRKTVMSSARDCNQVKSVLEVMLFVHTVSVTYKGEIATVYDDTHLTERSFAVLCWKAKQA